MGTKLDELYVELKAVDTGLRTALKEVSEQVSQLNKRTNKEVDGINAALDRLKRGFIAIGGVWGTIKLGKGFVDAGVQMQSLQNRMQAATGDLTVAGNAMAFVREESNRLGLDFRATADGFSSFAASALRAGLTLDEVKDIFTGVSEAATALQLSPERVSLVFQALSQMASKGAVSMEELRQQLGESLPGALQIFASAMGKPLPAFIKMIENGEVLVSDLKKLGDGLHREFADKAVTAAQSSQAAFNRLGNAWFDLQTKMANAGFLDAVTNAAVRLTSTLNDPQTQEGLRQFATLLGQIAEAAVKVAANFGFVASEVAKTVRGMATFKSMEQMSFEDKMSASYETLGQRALAEYIKSQGGGTDTGNYTLGKATAPGETDAQRRAREKAERLRQQMLGKVASIDQANARETDPQKQAALELEEQQKTLEKALEAKAITEEQYRQKSLESEIAYQDKLTDIRQKATDLEVDMRNKALNNIQALLEVFAGKNKAVAMALLVFDKARAIAQAIMETHVAAAAALKYDPTGATSAYVTSLGYANVAAIAATGIAQLATMSTGGGSSGGGVSYGSASGDSTVSSSATTSGDAGVSKSVYITLQGDSDTLFSKNRVRQLIESINDAIGDGSQLRIAVS